MAAATELDRLVNACLAPGFAGSSPPDWVRRAIDDSLGGVVLYGTNPPVLEGRVQTLAGPLREQRPDLLVALDEEGGDVTRLHYGTGSLFPGNLALGIVDDVELTRRVARAIGGALAAAEVNFDYAPSVDVNSDPSNPVIGVRSFGADPELVGAHGRAYVEGLQECGVAASAKHFPGHGATRTDSHHDLPVIDCDEETFRRRELAPFVAAIGAGAKSIMTAHVVFPHFDELPATLSRRFLTELLRDELGFDGVITTDALDMQAVSRTWGIAGAAVRALAAGADMLLLGADDGEELCAAIRSAVAQAVHDGELGSSRLEEAAERVRRLGDWAANPSVPEEDLSGVGLEAARRALRVEGALPLARAPFVVELRGETNPAVSAAHWSLAESLERLGFLAGVHRVTENAPDDLPAADGAPLVIASRDAYRHPWQRDWIARARAARPDAIVVAMGLPDDRELAGDTFLATYGAGLVNAVAAAEQLSGKTPPQSTSPAS